MSIMITKSGKFFNFDDPDNFDYDIGSIAWSLAHQCRFNGHIDTFYSVAQHSVGVSHIVPDKDALAGLLHDSAEAFMGDVVRPVKMVFPAIKELEEIIRRAIFRKFGLDEELPSVVKCADESMLSTERRDLLSFFPNTKEARKIWNPEEDFASQHLKIIPLPPVYAYDQFLSRFHDLKKFLG